MHVLKARAESSASSKLLQQCPTAMIWSGGGASAFKGDAAGAADKSSGTRVDACSVRHSGLHRGHRERGRGRGACATEGRFASGDLPTWRFACAPAGLDLAQLSKIEVLLDMPVSFTPAQLLTGCERHLHSATSGLQLKTVCLCACRRLHLHSRQVLFHEPCPPCARRPGQPASARAASNCHRSPALRAPWLQPWTTSPVKQSAGQQRSSHRWPSMQPATTLQLATEGNDRLISQAGISC